LTYYLSSENLQTFNYNEVFAQADNTNQNFENNIIVLSSDTNPSDTNPSDTNPSDTNPRKNNNKNNPILIRTDTTETKIHYKVSKILQNANPKAMAKLMNTPMYEDKLLVYVHLDDTKIQHKALDIEIVSQNKNIILSKLSWHQIKLLVNDDSIKKITLPERAVPLEHGISEGVEFSLADDLQAAGFDGKGIKIAVIDTDFYLNNTHYQDNIVYNFTSSLCSDISCGENYGSSHGTAVSEIVVDVAPAVDLYLYAISSVADFEFAIDHAISNDVDIITASLGFVDLIKQGEYEFWRDGTSDPALKVNEAKNNGTLVTIASGNSGIVHWSGFYVQNATRLGSNLETDLFDPDYGIVCADPTCDEKVVYQSVMMFNSTASNSSLQACLPAKYYAATTIEINWSDWPLTFNDYDFFIYDSTASNFLGAAFDSIVPENGVPPLRHLSAILEPGGLTTNPQDVCVVIASFNSTQNHLFHIDMNRFTGNEFNLPDFDSGRFGSLATPADSQGAFTVGAVDFNNTPTNYSDDQIRLYSSRGPTDDGRTAEGAQGRLKPEICGPDGTSTSQNQPPFGPTFTGTSGATPHVAGAAALLLEQDPSLNVTQLEQKLIDLARNDTDFSLDNLCGSDSGSLSLSNLVTFCTVDPSGNFTVSSDCTLSESGVADENVIVENNATLTIPPGVTLDVKADFDLILKSGGMVLVKKGGILS
jgi:subtilisin family serine protease